MDFLADCEFSSAESSTILSFQVIYLNYIANPVLGVLYFLPALLLKPFFRLISFAVGVGIFRRGSDRGIARENLCGRELLLKQSLGVHSLRAQMSSFIRSKLRGKIMAEPFTEIHHCYKTLPVDYIFADITVRCLVSAV